MAYYLVIINSSIGYGIRKRIMANSKSQKREIVTFKADESLLAALDHVPNRSEFIRNAVMAALENTCPLCNGTGVLTPNQQKHWQQFASRHAVEKCNKCHESYLVCTRTGSQN
jgi:K+-sensing histidine kinase KdpD